MASGNETRFRVLLPFLIAALLAVAMMIGYLWFSVMDLRRSDLETNSDVREMDGRYKAEIARLKAAVFLLTALLKGANKRQSKSNVGGQVSARPVAQSGREIIKKLKMKPIDSVGKQTEQRIRKGEDFPGDLQVGVI